MFAKLSLAATLVGSVFLAMSGTAHAVDKCDVASVLAMAEYGKLRTAIRNVGPFEENLAPATNAIMLVELYGCDMERVRSGIDCVEIDIPGTSEEQLVPLVLQCGEQVGLEFGTEDE